MKSWRKHEFPACHAPRSIGDRLVAEKNPSVLDALKVEYMLGVLANNATPRDGDLKHRYLLHHPYVRFGLMTNDRKRPEIVSVGSGNGHTEALLHRRFGVKIWCCDPEPECYADYVEDARIEPDYKTANDLVDDPERAGLIGTCGLFLGWTWYDGQGMYGDSPWDLECVKLLRPEWIVMVYGSCGASGSKALHRFMRNCGAPAAPDFGGGPDYEMPEDRYVLQHHHTVWQKKGNDVYKFTVALLVRSGCMCLPKKHMSSRLPHDHEYVPGIAQQ
jgi:hypothetical protein